MPPQTSDREISADLSGKRETSKNGKWSRKEVKPKKGRWKMGSGRRESYKMRRGLFFFVFVFFFLFLLFTFENHSNFFWVYQNGNFLPGKIISTPVKKSGKNDFAPSEKYSCYAPGCIQMVVAYPEKIRRSFWVS